MGNAPPRALRVALIADRETQGRDLKALLETNGLTVILDQTIRDYDPEKVTAELIDVLLVNLGDETSLDMDHLEALIERSTVPILFNEGGVPGGGGWGRKLIAKLSGLVQRRDSPEPAETAVEEVSPQVETEQDIVEPAQLTRATPQRPALRVVSPELERAAPAQTVWVLGSSLGGPQALKQFLSSLPDTLPIGFVIAQHIGKPFVELLAGQLDRVAAVRVMPAEAGRTLRMREVVLVPVDKRFRLSETGMVDLTDEPIRGPYKPCIDEVMEEVARCYGNHSGAIIFSGMGEDGAVGAKAINEAGGQVWAQDAESCVISSMPDATRKRSEVSFSGTPEQLAAQLAMQVGEQAGAL
ncbi:MAG: chemotaxis protein CheB [Gammaproteobacteria bacterium]|nr:chemotaxis protein CheB [Gammaproteobacteria bacterium]MBU2478730.1 chemotaxis protein CheB [Gammaproteobacteria bacterium]